MTPISHKRTPPDRVAIWCGGACLIAAGVLAYSNSFDGPFIFDDRLSIPQNATIRHLWPITGPLHVPGEGRTVDARPVLNLSLALSYALSGYAVWGYHLLNLIIHLLAALTLFGVVRRTAPLLAGPAAAPSRLPAEGPLAPGAPGIRRTLVPTAATALALAIALVWELHPLQTESVTYMIQRAESLMGLFYLLTLYGFIRAETAGLRGATAWRFASWLACLAGMGTKEVMVSAPLIVLAYDARFVAGSWRTALRLRRGYYLALAATWIPLAVLVIHSRSRGGSTGTNEAVGPLQYWLTQPGAITRYLRLTFWPAGQVFNYGAVWVESVKALAAPILVVGGLMVATAYGLLRRAGGGWANVGFLGLWFFAVLAPSSLVPGALQTVVEHRMYLASIPVIAGVALGLVAAGRRHRLWGPGAVAALGLALALPCAWATHRRNTDYASAVAIFLHDVAVQPDNPDAQAGLGSEYLRESRADLAVAPLRAAARLKPAWMLPEYDLGVALVILNQPAEAEAHYRKAMREDPDMDLYRVSFFLFQIQQGRREEAMRELGDWIRAKPSRAITLRATARRLERTKQTAGLIALSETLVRVLPDEPSTHIDLGVALAQLGRLAEAIDCYRDALRLDPVSAEAHYDLGQALAADHRPTEALAEFRAALKSRPNFTMAHLRLADVLAQSGAKDQALLEYRAAARLDPDSAYAQEMVARLQAAP
jgi:tetratricopeptide (TPR) repeat protein